MAFSQENDGGIVKNIRPFSSPVFSMDLLLSVILCFRTVETPVPTIISRLSLRFLEDLLLLVTVSSRVAEGVDPYGLLIILMFSMDGKNRKNDNVPSVEIIRFIYQLVGTGVSTVQFTANVLSVRKIIRPSKSVHLIRHS